MKLRIRYIDRPGTPGEILFKDKSSFIDETSFSDKKVYIDGIEVPTNPLVIPEGVLELTVLQIPEGMGNPAENFLNFITFGVYGAFKSQLKAGQEARRARELAQKFSEINTPSPASSIRGSNNTFRASGRIPIILGKHLLTPDLAAVPYSSYASDEQWYHQLFCVGYSEVSYSQVKIGDNPIGNYTASLNSGITHYPSLVSELVLGVELGYDKEIIKTTPEKTIMISVGISFPTGLRKYDDNADEKSAFVSFQISYRKVGGSWTNINISISEMKDYVRRMYSYSVSSGSYEVKIKRTSKSDTSAATVMDSAYWDVFQSHVTSNGNTVPVSNDVIGNYTFLSMKIKATGQLNGVINELNVIAELNCRDYSGTGSGPEAWVIRKSRNPASALLYVLTHPKINRRPISDEKILWSELEDFHTWCESKSFYFDAVLTGDYTLTDVADMITFAGRAHLTCYNGFFGVRIERKSQSIDFQLTPRNTKGSMNMNKVFTGNVKNLNCSFIDRTAGFTQVSRTCSLTPDGKIVYDYVQPGESTDVTFVGITDPEHMMKIAAFELAKASRRVVNYSVPQDWEQLTAFPGAVGYLASDMFLYGLGSGKIKAVYGNEQSQTVAIESDTDLSMKEGKNYSLMIRMNDPGHGIRIYPIQNSGNVASLIVFESPVDESIEPGNLFIFGERGKEGKRVLCESITPGSDQDGTLQLVDYCEEIYDADSGEIPIWDPGITISESSSTEPSYSLEEQIAKIHKNTNLQLAQKPTLEQIWEGYNYEVDGIPIATVIPVPPVITISSSGRSIFMSWKRQSNLTGSSIRYEIQILDSNFTSNDFMEGYSINPEMDGSYDSWQGNLGGVTIVFDQSITINNLPLDYQEGYSVPRQFFFRIRCWQSNSHVSDWSSTEITISPLDSKSMSKDSVTSQMIGADSIDGTHIQEDAITTKHLRADVISSLTASFDANILVGDQGFVGANYDMGESAHEYTVNDKRAFIDSDEMTFQEVKSVIENIPSWIDTLRIGGSTQEIKFMKPGKRIGFGLGTDSEVSISFAKRRDSYPKSVSSGYGAEVKSDGPIAFIDTDSDSVKMIYDPISNQIISDEPIKYNGNTLDSFPVGSFLMFDANTPDSIDGVRVLSGKAGEWVDNITIPGWYACVEGNQEKGCPNLVDRFVMGKVTEGSGTNGGLNAITLLTENLPSHSHTISHGHSVSVGAAGSHNHAISATSAGEAGSGKVTSGGQGNQGVAYTDAIGPHSHSIFNSNHYGSSGNTGNGIAIENRPAHYSIILIRKCA